MTVKFLIAICCVVSGAAASLSSDEVAWLHREVAAVELEPLSDFRAFAKQYNRPYRFDESSDEFQERHRVFSWNVQRIREINQYADAFRVDVNKFADLYHDEFLRLYTGLRGTDACSAPSMQTYDHRQLAAPLPDKFDWRSQGVVTPVKNQGQCGSCWAFATSGAVESAHAIKTGKLVSLSEQQILDCDKGNDDDGCEGGMPSRAYEYIMRAGGLEEESAYPYTAADEPSCAFKKSAVAASISSSMNITEGDLAGLQGALVEHGPVAVAVAVNFCFQFCPSGGLFTGNATDASGKNYCTLTGSPCGSSPSDVDHAVLVVGYDRDATTGIDFWWVKNSWGADWGTNGYIRYARGAAYGNLCGIATCASLPLP